MAATLSILLVLVSAANALTVSNTTLNAQSQTQNQTYSSSSSSAPTQTFESFWNALCTRAEAQPCNGTWVCPNNASPAYDPRYGSICLYPTDVTVTQVCPFGGVVDASSGLCTYTTDASSLGCPDLAVQTAGNQCVYAYPAMCPKGYTYARMYRSCARFEPAICKTCDVYACADGSVPTADGLCIADRYPAPANDAGYLVCGSGEVLVEKFCVRYVDAYYNGCATPSTTPSQPPCAKWACSGGVVPTHTSVFENPICIYSKYDAVANSSGYLNCPNGGSLWEKFCYIYENAYIAPCESITATPSPFPTREATKPSESPSPSPRAVEKPSETSTPSPFPTQRIIEKPSESPSPSPRAVEKPSETSTPSPFPTREASKPSETSTPTQKVVEKPSESPAQTAGCESYFCPGNVPLVYISTESEPVCVYGRYPASRNADGTLECLKGGRLVGDECILYEPSVYASCSPSPSATQRVVEKPSETSTPTQKVVEKPSETSTPSPSPTQRVVEKPSETSTPSPFPTQRVVEKPSETSTPTQKVASESPACASYFCPNNVPLLYISTESEPVCVYGHYPASRNADGTLECLKGGRLVGDECILYEPSVHASCSPSPTLRAVEKPSETSTPSPFPTREAIKPSESPSPTQRVVEKPSETPSPTPCDSYFCPNNMPLVYISRVSAPVCVYRKYAASKTADGALACNDGCVLVGEDCILYEPALCASPTPSVPMISATITIEIRTDLVTNTTSDLTVFENSTVLTSLKEAIAAALGVTPDMVILESVTWIENGVVKSTIRLNNATGGRRLQNAQNLDIKYKVVNAPSNLMVLAPEEYASLVERSDRLMSAAASVVSMATGVEVQQESIGVQSTEMKVSAPVLAAAPAPTAHETSAIGPAIGGSIVGVAVIASALVIYTRMRRRTRITSAPNFSRIEPEEYVTVANPLVAQRFSRMVTGDVENVFPPMQSRRV